MPVGSAFWLAMENFPHPGREYIVEAYYKITILPGLFAAPDFQHISNPAYNRDRGPVGVPGIRLHTEF
jgi:high affinity Mn2+ porin